MHLSGGPNQQAPAAQGLGPLADEEKLKEFIKEAIAGLDKVVNALAGTEDPEIASIREAKACERDGLKEQLRALKPFTTRVAIAATVKDKAAKRAQGLSEEAENLANLLETRRRELAHATEFVVCLPRLASALQWCLPHVAL